MPVPSEDAIANDIPVPLTMTQEFVDNNHCNAMVNHGHFTPYPTAMQQEVPLQSELYLVHVNSGDSFSIPQADGSVQNITGPVTVQVVVPNGAPPPITAPPGYGLHCSEDSGPGVRHIRILPQPVMEPPTSYVGSPSMPPPQPPVPMHAMPHIHPFFPGMLPNSNFYPQQMMYPEEAHLAGCNNRVQTQCVPQAASIANASQLRSGSAIQPVLSSQCSVDRPAGSGRRAVFNENVKVMSLSQPFNFQICTCDTCKDSLRRRNQDCQLCIMDLSDNVKNIATGKDTEVCTSISDTAFSSSSSKSLDEMSDNSFSSMSQSQSATPSSGSISGSSMQSRVLESSEWARGAPEHLHPEQSAFNDSPTRTSSSMTSSSPSASSMTSSPRNSPNLIPANGHRGSRSPLRQSPAARQFRPSPQVQGFVPQSTTYSSMSGHPNVPDDHMDKEQHSLQNSQLMSGESRPLDSIYELLKTVAKPEVEDIEIRSAHITWKKISLENSSPELCEKVGNKEISFDLLLSEMKKKNKFSTIYKGTKLEHTAENLKPGTDYSVKLVALYGAKSGPPSDITTFRTLSTAPDAPATPKIQKISKDSLHLKWLAPCENGEKVVKYYLEFDGGEKQNSFRMIYSGSNKNFKVQQLLPSHPYTFRLLAENKIGKSDWSPSITHYTNGVPPSIPDPPKLEHAAIDSLTLVWKPSDGALKFSLEKNDEKTGYGFRPEYNGPGFRRVVKNLARMTNYKFRLKAENNYGSSNYSQTVVFTTNPDKPLPPRIPHVKGSVHSYSVTLIWDAPRDDGGSVIVGYKVEKAKGNTVFTDVGHEGPGRECHVKDLEPGQLYRFRVISKTDKDSSAPSDALTITTRPISPGTSPTPSLALRPKPNCITIKWDLPEYTGGAEIIRYEVNWMPVSDSTESQLQVGYTGSKSECTIGDLLPGSKYSFAVRAANEVGFGGWSERLEVVTGPGSPSKPAIPEATVLGPHAISLDWKAPLTNGAEITKYSLQWGSTEAALSHHSTKGPVLSYQFSSLQPNTTYFYSLQAINSVGLSPSSDVGSTTTLPSCPERVSNLRLAQDTSESPQPSVTAHRVLFTWDAPRDNGSKILAFKVQVSCETSSNDTSCDAFDVEPNVMTFEAVDLSADTDYSFKVSAVNDLGNGPFSSTFTAHTKPLPPDAPTLECTQNSYNTLKLQWSCGAKTTTGTQYLLQKFLKKETGKRLQTLHRGPDQSYLVTGLNEQTSYSFRICAINSEGQGPFTTRHFTTGIQAPAALKSPVVRNIKTTECQVLWQKCNKIKGDPLFYRFTLEKQGKVLFEKDLEDTKYVLSKLAPRTTYHLSIAAVRYLSQKDRSSTPVGDNVSESSENLEADSSSEISGSTSPFVEVITKGSPSNAAEDPTLTPLVTPPSENAKAAPAKSQKTADPVPKRNEDPSALGALRNSISNVWHDEARVAHRQVAFFYICAILFAIITSWIYI